MAKLSRLINGQNVKFDTHQAGDGQPTNWRAVHLEKTFHSRRGKMRFPLVGDDEPSLSNGLSGRDAERITVEVRDVLSRNPALVNQLAETIVDVLWRFSSGTATSEDAKKAARRLAGYFDLDVRFLKVVEKYANDRLVSFVSTHTNKDTGYLQEISFSPSFVRVSRVK